MKMSDKFQLPVDCFVLTAKLNASCSISFLNVKSIVGKDHNKQSDCDFIKHAINNHDRLTEESAKLREVLERLVNPDNCKKDIIHIIGNAESLLNQLKKQNNDK